MNIYLDIDGVLIDKNGQPTKHVAEFLAHVTGKHEVYWLTTHCKGNAEPAVRHLKKSLPAEAHPYLEKIRATDWDTLKTEAIDFSQDFRWLDDYPMMSELGILAEHKAEKKIILIDLKKNPEVLGDFVSGGELS
jgi:hypothetical protein